jgi:predicted permease
MVSFGANFGLIFLCLGLGALFRRLKTFPTHAPASLNAFVMNVSLPAVALLTLHEISFGRELLFPVGMAWILFALACAFFALLGKLAGWSRETVGALILTGGLANTSFVGFPLLVALFGPDALRIGVLTDQPGTFLVLSTLGVATASLLASRGPSPLSKLPGKLLRFPPFVAMLIALALHPWAYPDALKEILSKLSATLIPLALVSVGMHVRFSPSLLRSNARPLALGLVFKLALAPAFFFALYVGLLGAHGEGIRITIVQSAMAPMITGAILAADHGLEPELANLMLALGIPLSLFSVPLWAYLLRSV